MGEIRVGTSSWADRSLVDSGWYPREFNTPAGRLAYYAGWFDLVEVDTSYYALPAVETAAAWADRTPPDFTFNVKAFGLFTGHPTPVSALPRDLRPTGRHDRVRRRDLAASAYDELWARFHAVLDPLAGAGKLGVVLLQFPPWLVDGEAARRRIAETAERCRPARVAVEFRHGSWLHGAAADRTREFLAGNDISLVGVDMPQGHPESVPPLLAVTAEPAVVRLHGHSPAWDSGDKREKFRYAYGEEELVGWARRLRGYARRAGTLHVLLNNCCAGQAQRDAARLADLLGVGAGRPARGPAVGAASARGGDRVRGALAAGERGEVGDRRFRDVV
ncbi:DUF72 domain-containing protein [Solwaraspora sp. WMMD1047]|uniref:DUF72 domain-containing protein n=1 Tax=Solwaraspora sp. WMMD1047 TaxID=3016102 RepID=UPI0024174C82|nr:DUF72 domain-containing protein [Solwaraspora sp. WMMD1047]MDG4832028.1 DUF72 domain-containing protein [Solwaraspora sp. WMMD1047]